MRLLLTADIHLGAPIRSAALRNPELGAGLRQASRDSLSDIVALAVCEAVDVLVLAGDIFDTGAPDLKARAFLTAQLARAAAAGIETVLIRGNHDALLDHTAQGALGPRIHLLDRARPTVEIGGTFFHGLSFEAGHHRKSLLPLYPAPRPEGRNVGLMHSSLEGAPGHDPYAPCAEADLMGFGYDLWCLGHIHAPFERRAGDVLAVMPGIPQPRHFGERRGGKVALVTLDPGAPPALEWRPVARLGFALARLDLSAAPDQTAVAAALRDAFAAAQDRKRETALRLEVISPRLGSADLTALANEIAADVERVHLDKVKRALPARTPGPESDDLMRLMRAGLGEPGFRHQAAEILEEIRQALPREIAATLDEAALDALLDEALSEVAAALHHGAEDG